MNHLPRWMCRVSFAACAAASASAQCLEWKSGFGIDGVDGDPGFINALASYDDGSGPALFLGGNFTTAGDTLAIAKWDGTSVSAVGGGVLDSQFHATEVHALAVFDDGSGPALYVGGRFDTAGGIAASSIARWDGSSWSALGTGVTCCRVRALAVFDDGSGPALFVGGDFSVAGGSPASRIAKWDGSSWSTLGTGAQGEVNALCVYDGGAGPALYVGGSFVTAGDVPTNAIARWDGTTWSSVAGGTGPGVAGGRVRALTVFDGGQGPELFVGGDFTKIGGVNASRIARWNGSTFSPLGQGAAGNVYSLAVADDGTGSALFAGGLFTNVGGMPQTNHIARWNGTSWSQLGVGLNKEASEETLPNALAITSFDDGSGAEVYVGGLFSLAGGNGVQSLARWNGSAWSPAIAGNGVDGRVMALTTYSDDQGLALYAGGSFLHAGGVATRNIARWDGASWSSVGAGLQSQGAPSGEPQPGVNALTVFDDGSGPKLIAGGGIVGSGIAHVAAWDGATWSGLGSGVNGTVYALCVFDAGSGPELYVGGDFEVAGGAPIRCIARWNGADWNGVASGTFFDVRALCVFDDGGGPALYVGGTYTFADGQNIKYISKLVGQTLQQVGPGIDRPVFALTTFDDGNGTALYVGGGHITNNPAGPIVAKWDGATWTQLGNFTPNTVVTALQVFDDGAGPSLYAGGTFFPSGSWTFNRLARWDGASWSNVGGGLNGEVLALGTFDDGAGHGQALFAGGEFETAGGTLSSSIAQWVGCNDPATPFCFGDGLDAQVTTACPCSNFGAPGHGCGNSVATGGALLSASGTIDPDTLDFTVTDVPAGVSTTYLQGNAVNMAGIVFGDGVRCAAGSLTRLGSHNDSDLDNSTSFGPSFGDPQISAVGAVQPGTTYWYQTSYRNPNPSWCPPATFNITNGLTINWP